MLDFCNLTPAKIEKNFFRNIAERVLKSKPALNDFEISLALLDDAEMRKINSQYRGQKRSTDVLSFNLGSSVAEIFICPEQADSQAKKLGHSLERELILLFIHGLLHVLGYSDETKIERKEMFRKQGIILKNLLLR